MNLSSLCALLRCESEQPPCPFVSLGPVAGVGELSREPGEGVDHGEHRKRAPLAGDVDSLFGQGPGDAPLAEHLEHLVGVAAERGFHRLLDDAGEPVASLVAFLDQVLDDATDVVERLMHVGRVFPFELHDLHRVPDDVE